ncbi:MAG: hypothetical protein KDD38_03515 [Bdellovibrionales bacterium]|nr:hypothetical protein [Bdellovibrionales bacterium]
MLPLKLPTVRCTIKNNFIQLAGLLIATGVSTVGVSADKEVGVRSSIDCSELINSDSISAFKIRNALQDFSKGLHQEIYPLEEIMTLIAMGVPYTEKFDVQRFVAMVSFISNMPKTMSQSDSTELSEEDWRKMIALSVTSIYIQYPQLESLSIKSLKERDKSERLSWIESAKKIYGTHLIVYQLDVSASVFRLQKGH